jgi:predicted TIM-barrel fold metal-dependent hydrolase
MIDVPPVDRAHADPARQAERAATVRRPGAKISALQLSGPDRSMWGRSTWGSNWPMTLLSEGYRRTATRVHGSGAGC